jgi:hypothetical protein
MVGDRLVKFISRKLVYLISSIFAATCFLDSVDQTATM